MLHKNWIIFSSIFSSPPKKMRIDQHPSLISPSFIYANTHSLLERNANKKNSKWHFIFLLHISCLPSFLSRFSFSFHLFSLLSIPPIEMPFFVIYKHIIFYGNKSNGWKKVSWFSYEFINSTCDINYEMDEVLRHKMRWIEQWKFWIMLS